MSARQCPECSSHLVIDELRDEVADLERQVEQQRWARNCLETAVQRLRELHRPPGMLHSFNPEDDGACEVCECICESEGALAATAPATAKEQG